MKVDNKILCYFYNKFGFIIRFTYCRIPLLNKLVFWKFYTSDFKKLDKNFEEMKNALLKSKFNFKNKVCLELGPGNSYINSYNSLMNGTKRVILVDKYPRHTKTKKQKRYFNQELYYLKKKYSKKNLFFIKKGKLDEKYIKFIPKDVSKLNLEKKIDFVYSINVLEHIKCVKSTIKQLSKIVKKNGFMYHQIDLRDHYNFNNPFLFYKYSNKIWNMFLTREGISYTNRLRYDDFKKLFKENDFKIIKEEIIRYPLNSKLRLSKNFERKSKDILNIGMVKLILKKT